MNLKPYKKTLKYKLIKTTSVFVIVSGLLTIAGDTKLISTIGSKGNDSDSFTTEQLMPQNPAETFYDKYSNQEQIVFTNEDIYNFLCSSPEVTMTNEGLSRVKNLTITYPFNNPDLSDLKFLPNLESLEIRDSNVDLSNLSLNQRLKNLKLENCNVINTNLLPDSITVLDLSSCIVTDNSLRIPPCTRNLYLLSTSFNNLSLKNPRNLKKLEVQGEGFLDIASLKECTNLQSLSLKYCSNVINSSTLADLPALKKLYLNDYAPIWLSNDTVNKLEAKEISIPNDIKIEIRALDAIASNLNATYEEDRVKNITLYILDNLTYTSLDDKDEYNKDRIVTACNDYPIKYALDNKTGVCINYACLFQSLANRLDVTSYQLFNDSHTWNLINLAGETSYVDTTFLDAAAIVKVLSENGYKPYRDSNNSSSDYLVDNRGEELYYYEFQIEDLLDPEKHIANLLPTEASFETTEEFTKEKEKLVKIVLPEKFMIIKYSSLIALLFLLKIISKQQEAKYNRRQEREILEYGAEIISASQTYNRTHGFDLYDDKDMTLSKKAKDLH